MDHALKEAIVRRCHHDAGRQLIDHPASGPNNQRLPAKGCVLESPPSTAMAWPFT